MIGDLALENISAEVTVVASIVGGEATHAVRGEKLALNAP
jgi:hypothetical protein